jgi:hypothetical protein
VLLLVSSAAGQERAFLLKQALVLNTNLFFWMLV